MMFFLNAHIQGTLLKMKTINCCSWAKLCSSKYSASECSAKPGPDMALHVIRVPFPTPQTVPAQREPALGSQQLWTSPLALLASSCIPFWQLDGLKEAAVPTFPEKSVAL